MYFSMSDRDISPANLLPLNIDSDVRGYPYVSGARTGCRNAVRLDAEKPGFFLKGGCFTHRP
jgi:hypothetical protein